MGFGCMSISANYGPAAARNQGIGVIRAAHGKGVTFVGFVPTNALLARGLGKG